MVLSYIWERFWKKLPGAAIRDSSLERPCKIGAQRTIIGTEMGRYSYCGYRCTLINCQIGRYCSIADDVSAGMGGHPMAWASTSPAFYMGGGGAAPGALVGESIGKVSPDEIQPALTHIGNDVWIGQGVFLKPGITVGDGAVIGMGSIVTRDVPPYTVVAGNPARMIRLRFPAELAERLEAVRWWDLEPSVLKRYSGLIDEPEKFVAALEAL